MLRRRRDLREILPDATEEMSYGIPAFALAGKKIAGFGYYKNHCSYFPHSGSVLPQLAAELEGYRWTKGTLQFPIDQSLPKPLLALLVDERCGQLDDDPR